ncbi:AzlD domain-containing protein [Azorhizobium doebereinerae]|uniref:AzlD domain-containing protein n=1 Tax=Azorhizobium doebereinerae TaxID=281091 RepID=UPI0004184533|nr:AzlD domain-containing protein [Azorhizobium doebereinerae]
MIYDNAWVAALIVIFVGFLPTEVWRWLAVFAGRRVEAGSELFNWIKAVATALLAAVVGRLVFVPTGALVGVPLGLRLASVAAGVLAFLLIRRSVLAGVAATQAVLLGGIWWLGIG